MKLFKKLKQKGFSLIELMVVVAIIAILASFAIPQYNSFQSKARQKEGLTLLNSFYTAAKATEAEIGWNPGNFEAIGFNPAGQVHFRVRTVDGTNPPYGPNNDTCIGTNVACNAAFQDWNEVTVGSFSAANPVGCTAATNSTNSTFTACASALIRGNAGTDADTWSINERKVLANTNDGIN
jgi:type IV pilus assembly protein PilA